MNEFLPWSRNLFQKVCFHILNAPTCQLLITTILGWGYGNSKSGWVNQDIFLRYLSGHFLPQMKARPGIKFPVILLVDGVKSHISIEIAGKKINKILKFIHLTIQF